jgi:6,7-dimethyl-8-ribityllumazine synthase
MEVTGNLNASGHKFALVVSRFNELFSTKLLDGAIDCLKRHGAVEKDIIPYAASRLAKSKKFDAIICLGVVVRGHTPHYEYIANEVAKGVAKIAMENDLPVIFGVITADTLEQAIERSGSKAGNRGFDAAMSAIEMVNLFKEI